MIRVLGVKRILILLFLVAINIAMGVSVYMFLMPQHQKKEREMRALQGQVTTVSGDINRMQIEFDQLADQQNQFEELKQNGFFYNQGRRKAEQVFEAIQKQAGVISAIASIQSGSIEENAEAAKAEHQILRSPVTIRVEAVDPADVYRYVYLLDHFFPGHIAIQNIKLERKSEVTGPVLRAIASGHNPLLVQADIQMIWRTMIPQSEVIGGATATP